MNNYKAEVLIPPSVQKEYEDPWNKLCIDLDAIKTNYNYLKSKLPPSVILFAVLKSDAYGHGITEIGKILSQSGCMHFAVESPQEGILLRKEDIGGEILLMNPIPAWMAEISVRYEFSVSVIHESILEPLEEACRFMGKTCRIHLNVNVGLNRMGIAPSKVLKVAKKALYMQHLKFEGLFAQPRDSSSSIESYNKLKEIYNLLKKEGCTPRCLHFANSTTFLAGPELVADRVRLGILLYGVLPPEQYKENYQSDTLKPAMSLKTELVQIRQLPKGSKIGYRSKEKTKQDLTIGTIPIGYYHGLDRKMIKEGYVLIKGQKAPFIGAISMNSSTIDITGIRDTGIGDEVVIIGKQGELEIRINELAERAGTIAAELMMRFGKSITRSYTMSEQDITSEITIENGKTKDISIRYYQTENELPEWVTVYDIIRFLKTHLVPYDDPQKVISHAVDYALSSYPNGKGFVLLATNNNSTIIGSMVSIQIDKIGIIPQNLLVYICVHPEYRGQGIGSRLVREAIECTEGDVKLHAKKATPAITFFKRLGFKDDYLEMRLFERAK